MSFVKIPYYPFIVFHELVLDSLLSISGPNGTLPSKLSDVPGHAAHAPGTPTLAYIHAHTHFLT